MHTAEGLLKVLPGEPKDDDWQQLKAFEAEADRNGQLEATDELQSLLRRIAPTLLIASEDVTDAACSPERLAEIVLEMRRRIREGSRQVMTAFSSAKGLVEAGRQDEARELLISTEKATMLPFYKEVIRAQTRAMGLT